MTAVVKTGSRHTGSAVEPTLIEAARAQRRVCLRSSVGGAGVPGDLGYLVEQRVQCVRELGEPSGAVLLDPGVYCKPAQK